MTGVEIKEYAEFNQHEILALYESAGWRYYVSHPEILHKAYQHSLKVLAAWCKGKLVGIIRAVGDGYTILYIQDIIVLPEYQGRGIGKALLYAMCEQYHGIYQKVLLTDNQPDTMSFYESCGFSQSNQIGCVAFVDIAH